MAVSRRRPLFAAVGGLLLYGGWGYLVNHGGAPRLAFRAALGQGTFSFAITLGASLLVEAVYARTRSSRVTVVLSLGIIYALLLTTHLVLGTPRIIATVAPGAVVTAIFVVVYARATARAAEAHAAAQGAAGVRGRT